MTLDEQQKAAFKKSKQRLSKAQLAIKKDLKEGRLPQVADADRFVTESGEMDRLGKKEWEAAMSTYMDRLNAFQEAMKQEQLQAIDDAFHGLLDCKVGCHKEFRKK